MIKTSKRIVAILLVVVMAISSFPIAAFAATEYIEGDYTYTVSDSKATIVAYPETAEGVVNIPSTLGGYPVTAIGSYAFWGCTLITEISIPASITSIGNSAFGFCTYLAVVNYAGTEAQWKKISIGSGNEYLTNATINYNSTSGFRYTQTHVVKDYQSKNDNYANSYFACSGSPMDGSGGTADYCIPGLLKNENMVPQGITYYPKKNWILISAYYKTESGSKKNVPSVIFALDKSTGNYVAEFEIYENKDVPHTEHVGGIAVSNYNLYLANEGNISYIPLSEFDVSVGTATKVEISGTKSIASQLGSAKAAYVTITDGVLYVGNFYNNSPKYNTRARKDYASVIVGYDLTGTSSIDEWNKLNIETSTYEYDIADSSGIKEIQCATVKNGKLFLSCSYGRTNDSLLKIINVGTNKYACFVCDEISYDSYTMPMMEGMTFIEDYLYAIFESGAYFYNGYKPTEVSKNPTDVVWKINYKSFPNTDIYNLGEETYRFDNFSDGDSNGHCFGMSMTSSGYYNNLLNIVSFGGNDKSDVYGLKYNPITIEPICHYQNIQGSKASKAMVAGGRAYKFLSIPNIRADWREVVDYVKYHQYDDKGTLQIGYRKTNEGGHAINFLRYAVVDGQERIYAYDNNFPNTEVYFYMSSDGKVYQAPYQTFSGAIDSICLRDIFTYFEKAKDFDSSRVIYGDASQISITDADVYLMDCSKSGSNYAMFELPEDVTTVNIKPLVDNASFKYVGEDYSFGEINDDTIGIFTLATSEETAPEEAELVITELSFSIQSPSRTEIRNKDGIMLHANVEGAPADSYIVWSASNGNFDADDLGGGRLEIIAKNKGWTTFTATLCDADDNVLAEDTVEMYSKSGFFDKIGGFFRSLFGTTKMYDVY